MASQFSQLSQASLAVFGSFVTDLPSAIPTKSSTWKALEPLQEENFSEHAQNYRVQSEVFFLPFFSSPPVLNSEVCTIVSLCTAPLIYTNGLSRSKKPTILSIAGA